MTQLRDQQSLNRITKSTSETDLLNGILSIALLMQNEDPPIPYILNFYSDGGVREMIFLNMTFKSTN